MGKISDFCCRCRCRAAAAAAAVLTSRSQGIQIHMPSLQPGCVPVRLCVCVGGWVVNLCQKSIKHARVRKSNNKEPGGCQHSPAAALSSFYIKICFLFANYARCNCRLQTISHMLVIVAAAATTTATISVKLIKHR